MLSDSGSVSFSSSMSSYSSGSSRLSVIVESKSCLERIVCCYVLVRCSNSSYLSLLNASFSVGNGTFTLTNDQQWVVKWSLVSISTWSLRSRSLTRWWRPRAGGRGRISPSSWRLLSLPPPAPGAPPWPAGRRERWPASLLCTYWNMIFSHLAVFTLHFTDSPALSWASLGSSLWEWRVGRHHLQAVLPLTSDLNHLHYTLRTSLLTLHRLYTPHGWHQATVDISFKLAWKFCIVLGFECYHLRALSVSVDISIYIALAFPNY